MGEGAGFRVKRGSAAVRGRLKGKLQRHRMEGYYVWSADKLLMILYSPSAFHAERSSPVNTRSPPS